MDSKCTGERYPGQSHWLSMVPGWHGKFGHLNTVTLDHDSVVTGYGVHDRVVAFLPKGNECYVRIDHVWALGFPTERQIIDVMHKHQDIKGRWKIDRIEPWDDGHATDVYLVRE